MRRESPDAFVRHPDEPRAEPRSGSQVRNRIRQVPEHGHDVLDLVGVEETKPFVDIRGNAELFQRLLVLAMALSRPEEDGDIAGTNRSMHSSVAIAHQHCLADEPRDFGSRRARTRLEGVSGQDPQHRGRVMSRNGLNGEAILLLVHKGVGSIGKLRDRVTEIVDERQERRNGAEAARDRATHVSTWPEPPHVVAGHAEQRDVGIAESVDRLLSIAHDEDRRRQRAGVCEPRPFTPRLHEQRHELPLRTTRILKLVDQDMVIPRFQAEATLRELLHLHGAARSS